MSCNKRSYLSEELAVTALLEARIKFDANTSTTVYCCDDCGQWHLTSKGSVHPRLASALKSGSVNKHKEADYWERKLR